MNALNLAVRCARLYTTGDPTAMSAEDTALLADAMTCGLADYWRNAPDWVRAPQGPTLATVNGTQTVALPGFVESVLRAPRVRASSTDAWTELTETVQPLDVAASGRPRFYRIQQVASALWSANGGMAEPAETIALYPTPDAVYTLDVWFRLGPPVIRMKHLAGPAITATLPVPDDHLITMVVPLCAPHFLRHPLKKADLTKESAYEDAARGARALSSLPGRRTKTRNKVGIPIGY